MTNISIKKLCNESINNWFYDILINILVTKNSAVVMTICTCTCRYILLKLPVCDVLIAVSLDFPSGVLFWVFLPSREFHDQELS